MLTLCRAGSARAKGVWRKASAELAVRKVRLVQQKLNSLGERLNADGMFGAATAAAVQRFQRRSGLTADGVVGEETWEKMF